MEMDVVESFDELVDALQARGVHGPGFRSMVAEYQAAEDKGALDIPKTPVGENPITNLDQPPFYVIPIAAAPSAAFGGVAIDTQAHVLNRANLPIENLFATACVAGGIFYNEYGGSLGASSTFGVVAARTALAELGY